MKHSDAFFFFFEFFVHSIFSFTFFSICIYCFIRQHVCYIYVIWGRFFFYIRNILFQCTYTSFQPDASSLFFMFITSYLVNLFRSLHHFFFILFAWICLFHWPNALPPRVFIWLESFIYIRLSNDYLDERH